MPLAGIVNETRTVTAHDGALGNRRDADMQRMLAKAAEKVRLSLAAQPMRGSTQERKSFSVESVQETFGISDRAAAGLCVNNFGNLICCRDIL